MRFGLIFDWNGFCDLEVKFESFFEEIIDSVWEIKKYFFFI